MVTRREFLGTSGAAALAAGLPKRARAEAEKTLRVAIITTVWNYQSHAQHIGDRFLVGYPHQGGWHMPPVKVVSAYVDQKPEADLSGERAKSFGFRVYPTIAEALRCGGNTLAVDAILIIGEHGQYPTNEKGQILYPRFEFFEQCVAVFEKDGRAVPIFNDKHLSYSFEKAKKMVAHSKRLGFPFLAGSSLPVTWRLPELELPYDCEIEEALMVGVGGSDPMDYHSLEAMQCMVERRRGGETGTKSVQLIEGDAVWDAGEKGIWSKRLLEAALSCSDQLQGLTLVDARTQDLVGSGALRKIVPNPAAYLIERRDGLKTTLLMLNGALADYNFACRLKGETEPRATQFFLTPTPNVTYSACLASNIEKMFTTGRAPYPVERTLTVCGILESCLTSKVRGHARLETPHLDVAYKAPQESHFCRA